MYLRENETTGCSREEMQNVFYLVFCFVRDNLTVWTSENQGDEAEAGEGEN